MLKLVAVILTLVFTFFMIPVQKVWADKRDCPDTQDQVIYVDAPPAITTPNPTVTTFKVTVAFDEKRADLATPVQLGLTTGALNTYRSPQYPISPPTRRESGRDISGRPTTLLIDDFTSPLPRKPGIYKLILYRLSAGAGWKQCEAGQVYVDDDELDQVQCSLTMPEEIQLKTNPPGDVPVNVTPLPHVFYQMLIYDRSKTTSLLTTPFLENQESPPKKLSISDARGIFPNGDKRYNLITNASQTIIPDIKGLPKGEYAAIIQAKKTYTNLGADDNYFYYCKVFPFSVVNTPTTAPVSSAAGPTIGSIRANQVASGSLSVDKVTGKGQTCDPLTGNLGDGAGIMTAIGCVPTEPSMFIKGLLRVSAGAGGGIALLMMAVGAFQMISSAGNPDGVKKGGQQFQSAVIGLLFIIFSVLLMQVIGLDILAIPGFGR